MLIEVGGFNEGFRVHACEDRELCDRWRKRGHPLRFAPEAVEVLVAAARAGIPCMVNTFGQLGASSPVTMAGCIAQTNAETLAGLAPALRPLPLRAGEAPSQLRSALSTRLSSTPVSCTGMARREIVTGRASSMSPISEPMPIS